MEGLQHRVALVTGSTSGIGHGIAHCLAKHGCDIILTGFGDQDTIDEIQKAIKSSVCASENVYGGYSIIYKNKYGVRADYVSGDLSKMNDIKSLCQQVDALYPSGIDILINNAGLQHVSPVEKFPVERWDYLIAVMLSAPFHLVQYFLPKMKEKGWGRIINIGSVHSLVASVNKAAYVSAKHGVSGLTKVVALEAAGSGVTCNVICPGFVETDMSLQYDDGGIHSIILAASDGGVIKRGGHIFKKQVEARAKQENCGYKEAKHQILKNVHPTGETVGVDQVAEFVAFVCSPAADQVTGSSLTMDAGWSAR